MAENHAFQVVVPVREGIVSATVGITSAIVGKMRLRTPGYWGYVILEALWYGLARQRALGLITINVIMGQIASGKAVY
jgi:hypothetical protein